MQFRKGQRVRNTEDGPYAEYGTFVRYEGTSAG